MCPTQTHDYLLTDTDEDQPTGTKAATQGYKTVVYPFDRYEITVKLTIDNKFVGIEQVALNRDFLSHKQKVSSVGSHEVEEYYRD